MTAASGIVHEELHEKEWAKQGGTLQMIQLWVNLPKSSKMSAVACVMNTKAELVQAVNDYQAGKMGLLNRDRNKA